MPIYRGWPKTWWWIPLLCVGIVVGFLLICWGSIDFVVVRPPFGFLTESEGFRGWARLLGIYAILIAVSNLVIHPILRYLRTAFGVFNPFECIPASYYRPPIVIGTVEAFIYLTALVRQKEDVIGAWIVLKTISQWDRWKGDPGDQKFLSPGRALFYVFLVGTAAQVALSLLAFHAVEQLAPEFIRPLYPSLQQALRIQP